MNTAKAHLKSIGKKDEYGTPQRLFQGMSLAYNVFPEIDICASKKNHVVSKYYTKKDNCLTKSIDKDFFMNPPYSRIKEFMRFAFSQHMQHNVNALILTFSKTDVSWWHDYVENIAEVHFIKGRVKFNDENGKPTKFNAPYPSAVIIYRKKSYRN